jgi:hypothetical protein
MKVKNRGRKRDAERRKKVSLKKQVTKNGRKIEKLKQKKEIQEVRK